MFKLFGAAGSKFTFSIEVHDVVLPDMLEHFDGTESLCVSFERKSKPPLYTQDKSVLLNRMDEITATFKETLKVDSTLYKDNKTGLYKEKMGKLTVLQRKRGVAGLNSNKDAFKTIGVAMIPMHEVVVDDDGKPSTESHDLQINLLWCVSENAYINVTVSAVDKDSTSETGSVNTEEHDDESAHVSSYNNNLNSSMSSFGNNNNSSSSGASRNAKSPTMFAPVNPPINEEEEYEDGYGSRPGGKAGKGSLGIAAGGSSSSGGAANRNDAIRKSMTSKLPPSGKPYGDSSNLSGGTEEDTFYGGATGSTPARSNNGQDKKAAGVKFSSDFTSSSATATPDNKAGVSRSAIKSSTPNRAFMSPEDKKFEASQLYGEMKQKIDNLEAAVLASEEIVTYERNRAAEAVASSNNSKISSQYLTELQNELQASRDENRKLKELLDEFNSSNSKTSGEMARLQSQLTKAADEIDHLMAERDKFEKASQDAASDNEALLADLIQQKVVNGNLATELEETKLELHNLKARVDAFNAKRAANGQPTANLGGAAGGAPKMSLDQRLAEHQQRLGGGGGAGAGGPAVGGAQQQQQQRRSMAPESFATPNRGGGGGNPNNGSGYYAPPNTAPQQRVNPLNGGNPNNNYNNNFNSNGNNNPNYTSNQALGIKKVNPFAGNNNSGGGAGGGGGMMNGLLRGFDSLTGGGNNNNEGSNGGGGGAMMRGFGGGNNNNNNGGRGNDGFVANNNGAYSNINYGNNNNGNNSYRPSNAYNNNNNNNRNYNNNYDDSY